MVLFGDKNPAEREASPDWLRTFQTPLKKFSTTVSSSSPSSSSHGAAASVDKARKEIPSVIKRTHHKELQNASPCVVDVDTDDSEDEAEKVFSTRGKSASKKMQEKGQKNAELKDPKRESEHLTQIQQAKIKDVAGNLTRDAEDEDEDNVAAARQAKIKDVAGNLTRDAEDEDEDHVAVARDDEPLQEGDTVEGQDRRTRHVASTLPLLLSDKVHRSKVLLECEGDALDLSGDVGAVGRFSLSTQDEGNPDVLFDLKGVIYKATIMPSNTFFVVNIGQADAKVEAIMSDFVQLQPNTNIYEAETMVEGTLEGFAFDSDEDVEKVSAVAAAARNKADQKEDVELPSKKKPKTSKIMKTLKGSEKKTLKASSSKASKKAISSRKNKSAGKSVKKTANSRKTKPTKK